MNESISVADNIDISIWGLILQADLVVRIVMLLLLILSIFCWALIFDIFTKIKNFTSHIYFQSIIISIFFDSC